MNCLVIAATAAEISPFLKHYRTANNFAAKHTIDVLITGIGLTATTYAITKQIALKRPDVIIQAGIAGCFDPKMQLASVVVVKQETIADQHVMETGSLKTMFDLKLLSENQFPFNNGWLVNKHPVLRKIKLKKVSAISVNEITTSAQKIKLYKEHFGPVVESMEGAALHYVGLLEKIPFVQLRGISNYISERNKKNWKIKESIINLNNELIGLLEKI